MKTHAILKAWAVQRRLKISELLAKIVNASSDSALERAARKAKLSRAIPRKAGES